MAGPPGYANVGQKWRRSPADELEVWDGEKYVMLASSPAGTPFIYEEYSVDGSTLWHTTKDSADRYFRLIRSDSINPGPAVPLSERTDELEVLIDAETIKAGVRLSAQVVRVIRNPDLSYNPTTVTFTSKTQTGAAYPGTIKIYELTSLTWALVYTSAAEESSHVHTPSAGISAIKAELYKVE